MGLFLGAGVALYAYQETEVFYRKNVRQISVLTASQLRRQLDHLILKGREITPDTWFEVQEAKEWYPVHRGTLKTSEPWIGISVYWRPHRHMRQWYPLFHQVLPEGRSNHLTKTNFTVLDRQFPLDLSDVYEEGKNDPDKISVIGGIIPDGTPIWRVAAPIGRQKLIRLELDRTRVLGDLFPKGWEADELTVLILDSRNRVVAQVGSVSLYSEMEDLSHLPVVSRIESTIKIHDAVDYRELPGQGLQHAYYTRLPDYGLKIIAQVPHSAVIRRVARYGGAWAVLLGLALLGAWIVTSVGIWRIVDRRINQVAFVLDQVEKGGGPHHQKTYFPGTSDTDEIGQLARRLERILSLKQDNATTQENKRAA